MTNLAGVNFYLQGQEINDSSKKLATMLMMRRGLPTSIKAKVGQKTVNSSLAQVTTILVPLMNIIMPCNGR